MGTFNERAENLMNKLTDIADEKTETKMLQLVNCVTLDVIAKVLCHGLFCSFLCSSPVFFLTISVHQRYVQSSCNYLSIYCMYVSFLDNFQVAFGVDLDLLVNSNSPFLKAIELCLKGMVFHVRDTFFEV